MNIPFRLIGRMVGGRRWALSGRKEKRTRSRRRENEDVRRNSVVDEVGCDSSDGQRKLCVDCIASLGGAGRGNDICTYLTPT